MIVLKETIKIHDKIMTNIKAISSKVSSIDKQQNNKYQGQISIHFIKFLAKPIMLMKLINKFKESKNQGTQTYMYKHTSNLTKS